MRGGCTRRFDCTKNQGQDNNMIERFSLDCRKTKTKVNRLANQRV